MPANLITLPHFSVSSVISLPKSPGEPRSRVPPNSASRALILGSVRTALISLLSLSTISAGVPVGAPAPHQELASYPGRKSPTVGMSGSASERVAVVTASARSLPALMYAIDEGTSQTTGTGPSVQCEQGCVAPSQRWPARRAQGRQRFLIFVSCAIH